MVMSVSVQEKREFLEWLLQHHSEESYELTWFLEELMIEDRTLKQVHFVEEIDEYPKGIIMTKHESDSFAFTFFKGKVSTKDVYTAYHEIHLYQQENLFIQVNFPGNQYNPFYRAVLEADMIFQRQAEETTELLLNQLLHTGQITYVKEKINDALEADDLKTFMEYSHQLKMLQNVE